MNRLLLAVSVGALCAAAIDARAQTNAQPKSAEQLRYEQEVREAEAARLRFEEAQRQYQADLARHRRELERAERAQRRYERRRARYDARHPARQPETEAAAPPASAPPAAPARAVQTAVPPAQCERQNRRNRGRGRAIGGLLGAVGGAAVGGSNVGRVAAAALGAPVGALIGDRIARLLDCREQEQAAAATEQAVERGVVGTTTNWASETRPGVTGSSTVTAAATPLPDGNPCLTVTDIVIIDGEETRAPKTMCRRPPTNRYVRV